MEMRNVDTGLSDDLADPISFRKAISIVNLISAYHEGEHGDGDSCIFFKDSPNLIFVVKEMIIKQKLFNWTLIDSHKFPLNEELIVNNEECFHFSDMCNDNCCLTTSKSFYEQQPVWTGLKIEI